jgi:virginiamycin B lyase
MPRSLSASLLTAAALALIPLTAAAQGQQQQPALPDGAAKPLVEGMCASCHVTGLINAGLGYTRDHWKELIGTMIDLSSVPDQQTAILDYLAANFPPNTRRAPKLVPGPIEITFKEWQMPQLGQRTRDPQQHSDGSIWYAGQYGNLLGRLDPKTGKAQEWALPANAMPHTVELDPKGRPWYTGNKNGTVGYIDPATGKATVFKMPDPDAKDPHTMAFDKNGIAYFSFQNSNMIGRLNPDTGEIKVKKVAEQRSQPYDVKFDRDDMLWVACNARPCLLKVNPDTLDVTEVTLPLAGTTVRRLYPTEDGMIWYVNSGKGQLGRLNPKTGEIKEWPSPSGPRSHPYAITVINGIVWYNESGMRPDALVRFDPKTETFQSWAIPSGNIYAGILRHSRAASDGSLLIHQSATNRVIQVTEKKRAASR